MTLVEVVVATALFATVVLVILGAFLACSVLTEQAKNLTQAVADARSVLERIRHDVQASTDIAAFPVGTPASTYEDWVANQQAAGAAFVGLTAEAVTVVYGTAGDDPLDVTVTVNWEERGGRARSTALQTQMTKR